MTTESSSTAAQNLEQQTENNSTHLAALVEQQYNVDATRSIALLFSCANEDCARTLIKGLFAKGTRVLTPQPEKDGDRYRLRVGVKRTLRDTVSDDFTKDMVQTADAMHGTYDGWDLITDEVAEVSQLLPEVTAA